MAGKEQAQAVTPEERPRRMTIDMSNELHKAIKLSSIEQGVTMVALVRSALEQNFLKSKTTMTSVTKDFVAKVAFGVAGCAILSIEETLSPHSVYAGSDIHPNLVLNDIKQGGVDEWAEYNLSERPKEPGIYTFRGSVRFDEDSADYSVTCDEL